jgi:16S rRNA (guanine527-N7)-methyltransferase
LWDWKNSSVVYVPRLQRLTDKKKLDGNGRFPYVFHVERAGDLADYLFQASQAVSIHVTSHQSDQFVEYARVLQEWNKTINLTSVNDRREVVVKHFIDSIAPLRFGLLTGQESVLDIGTGAGFPSVPLKIMRPDLRPVLLEPNTKKASFLLYLVGTLQLKNVQVIGQTLQQFAGTVVDRFDHVLVRALNQDTWSNRIAGFLSSDGSVLAYRSVVMKSQDIPPDLHLLSEWSYELPYGYGRRILAVLGKSS